MRLEKYLADCGIGTRSQCKIYIRQGMISVNGEKVKNGAMQVTKQDVVCFREQILTTQENFCFMFHKPSGCICATKDAAMKTVLDYFPKELRPKLRIVGRLDKDTEGLLLLTDDGTLIHRLMSPKKHVPKTYYFRAYGELVPDACDLVKNGMDIGDEKPTKPGTLENLTVDREVAAQTEAYDEKARPAVQPEKVISSGYLTISEGRFHQVKRMLHVMGCEVFYLKRISIGNLMLDEKLGQGEYRALAEEEYQMLFHESEN